MVNTVKKGQKKEYLARKELEKDGWIIAFKSIRTRFGCFDFGPNLFDIVAIKPQQRLNISCKHFGNGNYYIQHQQEIKQFKETYGLLNESFALWIWQSPRWRGRGSNKKWETGKFIKIVL